MSQADLEAVRELVSLCLRFGGSRPPANKHSWDGIISLAVDQGVAPLLWLRLKEQPLPKPVSARLWAIYAHTLAHNQELKVEQEKILAALARRGIPAWPLKGTHLSETLYGDLGARQLVDIDVLIHPRDLEPVDCTLNDLGYTRTTRDTLVRLRRSHQLLYQKPNPSGSAFALDLHLRLLPYGLRDPLAERVWAGGMTRETLLLYLCVNQMTHRFASLKYVCDLQALLEPAGNQLEWKEVVAAARELAFTPGIYYSLESVCELAGALVPEFVLTALRPGALDRKFARWVLGRDSVHMLSRSPRLEGPYGAFAILASTRAGARLRQAGQLLFPSAAYLRQEYAAEPEQATWPLYLDRWKRKVPRALRDLVRAVF